MREKIVFVFGLSIIGLCHAYIIPPFDNCTWGILNSELLIDSGSVITDAVLTVENIRPDANCINPSLYIQLLDNPNPGLVHINSTNTNPIQKWLECKQTLSLLANWKLDENAGHQAFDSSGNDHHGILINEPVWTASEGLSFQEDQYLEVADSDALNLRAPMAISLRFKMHTASPYAKLLIKPFEFPSNPWELYALDLGEDGTTPRFLLSDGVPGGQYVFVYNSEFKIVPDHWYYIIGTYDGHQMRLYVDSQLISQTTWLYADGQRIPQAETNLQIGTNSMPLCIGGRLGTQTFDGIIKDVRIYGSSNHFKKYGTSIKQIQLSELQESGANLSFSLRQVNDPDSEVWQIYTQPFELSLPDQPTSVSYSSALLELLDYAGTGATFGIGIDADGFLFDRISLHLTVESYLYPEEPQVQTFQYPPSILLPSDTINTEPGKFISFPVFLEGDGNYYTVSAKNLPPLADFSNQTFTWRVPPTQKPGIYTVTFEATDGVVTVQKKIQISVGRSPNIIII